MTPAVLIALGYSGFCLLVALHNLVARCTTNITGPDRRRS